MTNKNKEQVFQVTDNDLRLRADNVIARELPELSRGMIKRLAKEDKLIFNGAAVDAGYKFKTTGELVLQYDVTELNNIAELDLPVIYEDDDLIVIDKPSGVITHARGKFWDEPSVASSIRKKVNRDDNSLRAGIVHRLDRGTSGIIICAKNDKAAAFVQKQFAARTVEKEYVAVINSSKLPDHALIDKPIQRNPKEPSKFRVGANGKPAQTEIIVETRGNDYDLVRLKPKTGRTHQIRLHLLSVGYPILGDTLYDGKEAPRLMLHANKISLTHPNGDYVEFEAPIPSEFMDYN